METLLNQLAGNTTIENHLVYVELYVIYVLCGSNSLAYIRELNQFSKLRHYRNPNTPGAAIHMLGGQPKV